MSVSNTIKSQLISKVQSCDSVQQVYGHEELNPSGFPAVMVTAGDMEGEFASSAEDSRVYSYRVFITFPIGQDYPVPPQTNRMEYAEQVIATSIDQIIDAIDTDFELDGTPVLFTHAVDVTWGYTAYEGGDARCAELFIRVYTEKVVSS